MRETKLFAKLKPHLMTWGEYDRVENVLGSGMSDVFYNIGGITGWIETKVAKGDLVYFEKFQPNWMRKHVRLGARVFVMILDKREIIHLYPAGVVLKAPSSSLDKWITVDMKTLPPAFKMDPPYRAWKSIRDILIS